MRTVPFLGVAGQRGSLEGLRVSPVVLGVAGTFLVGLALRLVWVFYTDTIPLGGDPHWYFVVGANLANGFGFVSNSNSSQLGEFVGPGEPTAFWPPGYSLLLGAFWRVFGVSLTSAQVLNAVFGALTIPFIFLLGRRLFSPWVGLAAAGLFAVFPNAIAWTPLLFPEQLFILLFVTALWVLVAFPVTSLRDDWKPLVIFGLLTGLATLTRGQGAMLVPIAMVYWLARSGWRPTAGMTAVSLLAAAAIIAPWTIRNAIELHAFVPISTNSGAALRAGHAPDSIGTTKWTSDYVNGFYMWESLYRPDWEVQGYREYTRLAIGYAATNPGSEVELTGSKIYHLYRSDSGVIPWLTTLGSTPFKNENLEGGLYKLFDYSYYAVFFAALASVPFWLRRKPGPLMLASTVVIWTVFHVIFLGEPRYHVPLYPVFAIGVAAGAWLLVTRGPALVTEWTSRTRD